MRAATKNNPLQDPDVYSYYSEHPVEWVQNALSVQLSSVQKQILQSLKSNRFTAVISGNGVGKSYDVACGVLWWHLTRPDSVVLITSGSYSQMEDTIWRPVKSLLKQAEWPTAPYSRALDSNPPSLEGPEEEWYAKLVSPRNPDGLEGRHNAETLVVIEEGDKPEITSDHFDSAESAITSPDDRMIAIGNPPRTESNSFYEVMNSDRWEKVQFSSFQSHNVQLDLGETSGEPIPGLVDLPSVASDWENYNARSWPGLDRPVDELIEDMNSGKVPRDEVIDKLRSGADDVRRAHRDESTLSERWYRRRAGVIPKADARPHRPIYSDQVKQAVTRAAPDDQGEVVAVGIDVARKGGDETVLVFLYEKTVEVHAWSHTDHTQNKQRIKSLLSRCPDVPVAIDAVGEGSGLADWTTNRFEAVRFKAGEGAVDEDNFRNCWTEGLHHAGNRLDNMRLSGAPDKLKEDLHSAGRVVQYTEKQLKSGDVLQATPKKEIKEHQGRSPDHLDGYMMACWIDGVELDEGSGLFSGRSLYG